MTYPILVQNLVYYLIVEMCTIIRNQGSRSSKMRKDVVAQELSNNLGIISSCWNRFYPLLKHNLLPRRCTNCCTMQGMVP